MCHVILTTPLSGIYYRQAGTYCSNKFAVNRLLKIPPYRAFVATLLATYASSGRTFNNHFTANLLENLPVKKMKSVEI